MVLHIFWINCFIITFVTFKDKFVSTRFAMIEFLMFPHYDHLRGFEIANSARELFVLDITNRPSFIAVSFSPVKDHVASLVGFIFAKLALPYVMCGYRVPTMVQFLVPLEKQVVQSLVVARFTRELVFINF